MTAYERGLITRGHLLESLGLSPFAPIDPLVRDEVRPLPPPDPRPDDS